MLNSEQNLPPIFIGALHEQLNSIVEAQVSDPAEAEQAQRKPIVAMEPAT